MTTVIRIGGLAFAGMMLVTHAGITQSLERRVTAAPNGTVRFTFAARDGVCHNGRNVNIRSSSHDSDWESDCEHGPVHTALSVSGGKVTKVATYVGGHWKQVTANVTDLGNVPAKDAAEYLVSIAGQGMSGSNDAVFAATLADSVEIWPSLLKLARNESLPRETRRTAIFWMGQAAGSAATASLDSIARDDNGNREVRDAAVFAISQRPRDESVPALIRLARNDRDPEIRRKAIFWLGQSDDPRALALFEDLLTRR